MTRINIYPLDRISNGDTAYRLVTSNEAGFVIARVGGSGAELHQNLTHQQLREAIDANIIRIDRNWYDEGRARARLMAGVSSLNELPRREANEMLRQRHYIDEFLKREAVDKKITRTDASFENVLKQIDADRPTEGKRCDVAVESKPRPSARTFRRWLKRYEAGGYDVLALRSRIRHRGNRVSPIHPEADRILQKYVVGYCDERRKTKRKLYDEMRAEIKVLNDDRETRGLEPLS